LYVEAMRAVVEEHRARGRDAQSLTGLSTGLAHLHTSLEAVAARVRQQEERPAALLTPVPTSTREQLVAAGRLVAAKRTFDRPPRPPRTIVLSTADELVELDRSAAR